MKKYFLLFILFSFQLFAIDIKTIKTKLVNKLPKLEITKIESTSIPNIYEVISGNKVFYTDTTANYLIIGNIIDLNLKTNLTQNKIDTLSKIKFSDLPLDQAIIHINGDGSHKIAVFTDPHCPFCQKLEQTTLKNLSNTTIYYFLLPAANHVGAESDAKKILCSENKEQVFLDYMRDGNELKNNNMSCNSIKLLDTFKYIAQKINIEATPSIIMEDGRVIVGAVSLDYLKQLLNIK
jgi:thiol:disulfide interchange protein DsbC